MWSKSRFEHCKNCECCVPVTMWMLILLFSIVRNVISVSSVKSQLTSLIALKGCSLNVMVIVIVNFGQHSFYFSLSLYFFWSGHVSSHHSDQMSERSQVPRVTLKMFSKCLCLCHCLFVDQVRPPHYSDNMPPGSQVSQSVFKSVVLVSHSVTRSPIELFGDS